VLIERRVGTSVHPKARGLNVRTLELFRVWGIEAAVRAAGAELNALNGALDIVWAPTLVAPETMRMPYGGAGERWATDSPTTSAWCPQEKLEPVLLVEATRSYGLGGVRFYQELTGLHQDGTGVTATVLDCATGVQDTIRAEWVIAADGARSTVRSLLGIGSVGPGPLFHRMGIHFRADLGEIIAQRQAHMFFVSPLGGGGPIGPQNLAENRWRYQAPFHPERGERTDDFSAKRCVQLVRDAVGVEDLEVELLGPNRGRDRRRSRSAFESAGCSSPEMQPMKSYRLEVRASTWASRLSTTWPGSWRDGFVVGRVNRCWRHTRQSDVLSPS
jgi:putative polyketide hydroxylase